MDENQSKVKNVDEEVNLREEVKARQNTKYFIHPITHNGHNNGLEA